jgi:hypothetical protein
MRRVHNRQALAAQVLRQHDGQRHVVIDDQYASSQRFISTARRKAATDYAASRGHRLHRNRCQGGPGGSEYLHPLP